MYAIFYHIYAYMTYHTHSTRQKYRCWVCKEGADRNERSPCGPDADLICNWCGLAGDDAIGMEGPSHLSKITPPNALQCAYSLPYHHGPYWSSLLYRLTSLFHVSESLENRSPMIKLDWILRVSGWIYPSKLSKSIKIVCFSCKATIFKTGSYKLTC